jgi:hypothetical protein
MSCLNLGDDGLEDDEKSIGNDEDKFRDDEKTMGNDGDGDVTKKKVEDKKNKPNNIQWVLKKLEFLVPYSK